MAKEMTRSRLGDARSVHHQPHLAGDVVGVQRSPGGADEQELLRGIVAELRTGLGQILVQPVQSSLAQRYVAILLALAQADQDHVALAVNVAAHQPEYFLAPQPTAVEQLEDRSHAQSAGARDVGLLKHGFDFLLRERVTRQPLLFLGEDHFQRRVQLDDALVLHPLHPGA